MSIIGYASVSTDRPLTHSNPLCELRERREYLRRRSAAPLPIGRHWPRQLLALVAVMFC